MSLFSLDGIDLGGSGDSGDSDLSSLFGLSGTGVGSAYDFTTSVDATPSSATSNTLGQLQSGGSTIDWNQIIQGGLSTLIAADSIQHGLTASGQVPTYKAPNGAVYPVGQGPAMYGNQGGSLFLLLIIGLVIFAVAEEKK
ncbi:hypothetical protein [Burkholderia gladioli]|uniref:hypothetical protein n=1 Tax=Burkholderia gladioli TaxID=28095 RepID=UPI001640F132|nr:hypothetical protein [Burkholderia gladioli]MBU9320397.1 hypothetical protein [Burkholderia gladioli]